MIKKHPARFDLSKNAQILLKASLVANFGIGLFAPIYAIYVEKIGGNILDAGIAYAIFSIVAGILIIFIGTSKFFEKNLRALIILGYLFMGFTYLGYLLVKTPVHLFIVQIFLGITNGILEPSWDAVFSAKSSEKQEVKNWSLWAGWVSIIIGLSALMGSYIARFSFDIIFIIMSICAFISAIISSRILKIR